MGTSSERSEDARKGPHERRRAPVSTIRTHRTNTLTLFGITAPPAKTASRRQFLSEPNAGSSKVITTRSAPGKRTAVEIENARADVRCEIARLKDRIGLLAKQVRFLEGIDEDLADEE